VNRHITTHYLVTPDGPDLTLCGKTPGDFVYGTRMIDDVDCEACLYKFDDLRRRWLRMGWPVRKIRLEDK
jgi:hypothetical protein